VSFSSSAVAIACAPRMRHSYHRQSVEVGDCQRAV